MLTDLKPNIDLNLLTGRTTPTRIKRSLNTSLFAYLMQLDVDLLPNDFKNVIEDHYYLLEFLGTVDEK